MARENSTTFLGDINEYATRYGLDALGYAVLEMVKNNEINFTQAQTEALWEYGGNIQE